MCLIVIYLGLNYVDIIVREFCIGINVNMFVVLRYCFLFFLECFIKY